MQKITVMKISKAILIAQTNYFLIEMESLNVDHKSVEWYLSNNLKKFLHSVQTANTPFEIKNATKILSRFCTESMNWDTKLYAKCIVLTRIGFQLGKEDYIE